MRSIIDKFLAIIREREFIAKVISLLLAVVLWVIISSSKTEKLEFKIPIELKNLPQYLMVSKISNKYVAVVMKGKKEYLKNVHVKNIKAFVNLQNPKIGEPKRYSIELTKQHIPESIYIELLKKKVNITVERREDKWIRVSPKIIGNVQDGKIMGEIRIDPERVKISGPSSVIKDINIIYTENISVDNELSSFKRKVGLKRENLPNVVFNEINITITVPIFDSENLYSLNVAVKVRNIDENYDYLLENSEIKIYVRTKDKRKIVSDDVNAYIDAGKINYKKLAGKLNGKEIRKEMPVVVQLKDTEMADVVWIMPKKVMLKIIKK